MGCWSFWSWCEGAPALLQPDHLHWHQGARTSRALGKDFVKGQQRVCAAAQSQVQGVGKVHALRIGAERRAHSLCLYQPEIGKVQQHAKSVRNLGGAAAIGLQHPDQSSITVTGAVNTWPEPSSALARLNCAASSCSSKRASTLVSSAFMRRCVL